MIDTIKTRFKDCLQCINFITTRLLFVVMLGSVLGIASNQMVESYPASKLFYEVKTSVISPSEHNEIKIKEKL